MAQTTITLSFDVAALVPDDLPGVEALRSALDDGVPGDWWSSESGDSWWLEHINTTPPQSERVNAQLLEACRDVDRDYSSLGGMGTLPRPLIERVRAAIAKADSS